MKFQLDEPQGGNTISRHEGQRIWVNGRLHERSLLEIESWAHEHELPCDAQGHVQFPDVRIEYEIDGREHSLDVEVMTPHYRGAHAAGKSSSGFSLYFSGRGGGGGRGGGRARGHAEEFL